MKRTLLGLMVAASFAALALPAQAQVGVVLNFGPPAPRYEPAPPPRYGYVWESGYWQWNGRRHVWVAGHWERARPGYAYNSPRWIERGGRWHYQESRWTRDGDGVVRERDRDDNIIHPGGRPGDRDGDGVPDDVDSEPDNRNRG